MTLRHPLLLLVGLFLALGSATWAAPPARDAVAAPPSLVFVENKGQWEADARFQLLGANTPLWVAEDGLWLTQLDGANPSVAARGAHIKVTFEGAAPQPRIEPFAPQRGTFSFYRGSERSGWQERVPLWGGVRLVDLYPGVDLELSGTSGQLVLRVVAQASAARRGAPLRLRVEGAAPVVVDGQLFLDSAAGRTAFPLPDSALPWQVSGRTRDGRAVTLVLPAASRAAGQVRATVQGADALRYSTFMGTSLWDEAQAITYDDAGNVYVGGYTYSLEFPRAAGAFQPSAHAVEAFITKIEGDSSNLAWTVLFTAYVEEYTTALAVDDAGMVYAGGQSDSSDFPTTVGAFDTTHSGDFDFDGFIVKIRPDGTLAFSTLLGDTGAEELSSLAIDGAGYAYVAGGTWADAFPTTPDAFSGRNNGQRDGFVAKLSPDGSTLEYGSFLGGSGQEQVEGMVLTGDNTLYLTGWTRSDDFPTTPGAFSSTFSGNMDAYAVKMTLGESTLGYASYLGGPDEDRGYAIAVDATGRATVAGSTTSATFPTTAGAFDERYGGGTCDFSPCPDGFFSQFAADGGSLTVSSYLGGEARDLANALLLDAAGNLYLTGETRSADFPTSADGYDRTLGGERDAFVVKVQADGASLAYGTFLGGDDWDEANALARDAAGLLYVAGSTRSTDFPVTANAYATSNSGDYDVFVSVLDIAPPLPPTPTPSPTLSPTATPTATPVPAGSPLFLPLIQR